MAKRRHGRGAKFIYYDYSKRFRSRIEMATVQGIDAAARELQRLVRMRISTPYPPASRPGKPPHLRTGNLWRGIILNRGRRSQRLKTTLVGWSRRAIYGFYHERGINYPKAGFQQRPHIGPTFRMYAGRLAQVALQHMKKRLRRR